MMNEYLVRILTSESFIAFLATLLVMVILYLIVRYFTYRSGVNDLLKKADKRIVSLKKAVRKVRVLCTTPGARKLLFSNVENLKTVLRCHKRASRLLCAYLFDDRDDRDVAEAKAIVDAVPDICRAAIVSVAEASGENLNEKFDNLFTEMERARSLLHKAKAIDKKKELLQIT
ncbi:MAG: hypothetical protein ILP16_07845 [Spirochaetales bacterium]|nr:hypothetical protein [Spirochaetales bacterium]